jgi:hypothetical protein
MCEHLSVSHSSSHLFAPVLLTPPLASNREILLLEVPWSFSVEPFLYVRVHSRE